MAIPASDRLKTALYESHRKVCYLQVMNPDVPDVVVPVVDGQTTADRTRAVRYACDLTLDPDTDISELVSPYRSRVRLWRGVDFAGDWTAAGGGSDVEVVSCGTFRVQDIARSLPKGRLQLTGMGMDAYVQDDKFFTPGFYAGGSALQGIHRFVSESIPTAFNLTISDRVADVFVPSATWDTDRWGSDSAACQALARSLGAEVYADVMGNFVVRATPGMGDAIVGHTVGGAYADADTPASLVTVNKNYSRDQVFNVVVASSSRTGGGQVPDPGVAWDADPWSPTFLGADPYAAPEGAFGRSVLRYDSPLIDTFDAGRLVARSLLADNRGLVTQTGVTQLADPTIEPGDVRVVETDLGIETQLIDSLSLPVSGGPMSLTCRSTRITISVRKIGRRRYQSLV